MTPKHKPGQHENSFKKISHELDMLSIGESDNTQCEGEIECNTIRRLQAQEMCIPEDTG